MTLQFKIQQPDSSKEVQHIITQTVKSNQLRIKCIVSDFSVYITFWKWKVNDFKIKVVDLMVYTNNKSIVVYSDIKV